MCGSRNHLLLGVLLALTALACNKSDPAAPGAATGAASGAATSSGPPATEEGARQLLTAFLKPGADHAALSKALRPKVADYEAVFEKDIAGALDKMYGPAWDQGKLVIKPNEGQTELNLWKATSEELKAGSGDAPQFPGGYRQVAPKLKSGQTLYRFKFVKPGETLGMAYDGLVHVNGRWVIMPKPWRAMSAEN